MSCTIYLQNGFSPSLLPRHCSCVRQCQHAAQTAATGTITGTLTDSSGAVVPNAAVTILDTDTGVSREAKTTDAGVYTATFLQPGHYEVVMGGGGFGKVDRKNLVLTVGQTLTVDASLAVGSTATEVTVTSESPILDPQKTEVSQTMDQQLIANLPVATRNWSSFVLLTPNVVQDGSSGLVSFHGISGLYNQNYVDGANNNQILFSEARGRASGAPYVYSVDSIKEFQAQDLELLGGVRTSGGRTGERDHAERRQRHPRRSLLFVALSVAERSGSVDEVHGAAQHIEPSCGRHSF